MSRYANSYTKPILKWAGGKTQMLGEIVPRMPRKYNKYVEPFFGSGALYFAVSPENAIIADSNVELINLYRELPRNVNDIIAILNNYRNTKEYFYEIRSMDWTQLSPTEAAARTIYLNKTCFNGLYRVNRQGVFNTPYGNNKRTVFYDDDNIHKASELLANANILCEDYHKILMNYAEKDDFVFLDPPYVPVSKYSDFKRYTKDQFGEDDQRKLAADVKELCDRGCKVMITNSNHPLVHELYSAYHIEVFQTKRMINKNGSNRIGEDVIVTTY